MTNIPIFLSSDNNYAPFVATTIASICDNTKSFVEFYVLDGGISEENKEKILELKKQFNHFEIEFIKIDINKYFRDFKSLAHLGISTYNRLLIPELKTGLKKVLYLDVDIIVKGDIENLYREQIDNYSIGAICENYFNDEELKNNLNLPRNHKYFNAGILLMNWDKLRNENFFSACLEIEEKYRDKLKWADQDILNIYLKNNYKELDEKYNYTTQNARLKPGKDFIIRHFTTSVKPWHIHPDLNSDILPNTMDFWHYAKMTPFYEEMLSKVKYKDKMALRVLQLLFQKESRKY